MCLRDRLRYRYIMRFLSSTEIYRVYKELANTGLSNVRYTAVMPYF
ncbi:Uncharacterised protein [Legionella geestiana]|nr:Uncharacterised protein [Legionella geestiana]